MIESDAADSRRRGTPTTIADTSHATSHVPRMLTRATLARGARHLATIDADLGRILDLHGEPPLWGRRPGFETLVRVILEQQVSLAAAATIYRRLCAQFGGMTPEAVHSAGVEGLRGLGLTGQKARYCAGLAERILDRALDLSSISRLPDEHGRRLLLEVPGLGPWSVDIYYLMALRRPDIWPQGDLALAAALRTVKSLDRLPSNEEQRQLAEEWAPWRSVAARILWMHYLAERGKYVSNVG